MARGDGPIEHDGRLLETLKRLLTIRALELRPALDEACSLLSDVLRADKVDLFLYDARIDSLVAAGTSDTTMGQRQHALGLERLPLANGGLAVETYRDGQSLLVGRADDDPRELRGIVEGLGVRSEVLCPVEVAGERRGVLSVVAREPERFTEADLDFLLVVADWMGLMVHRGELFEARAKDAVRRGRRELAEELAMLTPRQREVAALLAQGLSNDEIAERLVLTTGTVANHVQAILERLRLRSRTQVAVWAVEHGLYATTDEPGGAE